MASLTLYNMREPKNVCGKTLENGYTKTISFKNDFDFNNPVFVLDYDANVFGYNYCSLDFNGYKYFINSKEVINHQIYLHCHVDGLETLRDDIQASTGVITRSNVGNNYIPDNMVTTTAEHKIQYRKLGNGFTKSNNYVITLAG